MNAFAGESRLYRTLGLATDLVVLNLALVLVSLPVLTSGAGLLACFAVCLHMVQGSGSKPLRTFFASFKRGFVPATVLWLAMLIVGALLVWEWLVTGQLISAGLAWAIRAVLLLAALLLGLVNIWVWPLLAARINADERVRLTELPALLQTALLAGIKHLPRSLLGLLVVTLPPAIALVSVEIGARLILWFALIGWALACYLVVLLLRRPLGLELPADD